MLRKDVLKHLLKLMRAKRSQAQISRKLGHADIQVYRWESGRVSMKWTDFMDYAVACGLDPYKAFHETQFLRIKGKETSVLVKFLMGSHKYKDVSMLTKIPLNRVKKIASGHGQANFFEMCELIYLASGTYSNFFGHLIDYSNHTFLVQELGHPLTNKDGYFEKNPLAAFILLWLYEGKDEIVDYQGFCEQLALNTLEELTSIKSIIKQLTEFGYIEHKRDRLKILVNPYDRTINLEETTATLYHWLNTIHQKRKSKDKDFQPWEFIFINVDDDTLVKLKKLQNEFFTGVYSLASKVPSSKILNYRFVFGGMLDILPDKSKILK